MPDLNKEIMRYPQKHLAQSPRTEYIENQPAAVTPLL